MGQGNLSDVPGEGPQMKPGVHSWHRALPGVSVNDPGAQGRHAKPPPPPPRGWESRGGGAGAWGVAVEEGLKKVPTAHPVQPPWEAVG